MSEKIERDPENYPTGAAQQSQIAKRHRTGSLGRTLFLLATASAVIVLTVLLLTIINQSTKFFIDSIYKLFSGLSTTSNLHKF